MSLHCLLRPVCPNEYGKYSTFCLCPGPVYSFTRMTWVKTNFLWMMYRSGWGRKRNQERTLAIYLTREGFDTILRGAKGAGIPLDRHLPGKINKIYLFIYL